MPRVMVHRIIAEPIEVEVPVRCPECNADLTQRDALAQYEYVARMFHARLPGDIENPPPEGEQDGVLLNFDHPWDECDGGSLPTETIECKCGVVLADGRPPAVL